MFVINIVKNIPFLVKIILTSLNIMKKIYMIFCNKFYGIDNNKIVFISFYGKTYSDNPKAISEKIYEINPNIKIIWLFLDPKAKEKIVPNYITCIQAKTFKALKVLATSKVWVDNFNKPLYFYKSKNQIYIQTWHGDRALKKILFDSTFAPKNYKLYETKKCDIIVTGSVFAEKMYRSAYRYNGNYLKVGSPRNDALININEDRIHKIKLKLGLNINHKILLYAPTLRRKAEKEKSKQEIGDLDLLGIMDRLNLNSDSKWICLVRAHSAVSGLNNLPKSNDIIDVTEYEDMADLLQITDLLITDYSSSATDFILTNKPTILYQSDYQDYIKYDRSFYHNIEDIGFITAYSQEELYNKLELVSKEDIISRNKSIQSFYGAYEVGDASKKVAEFIINNLGT